MALSNVTKTTPNPNGGEIVKDAGGDPIGFLNETASNLVKRGAGEPALTPAERLARDREVLTLAANEALAKGITSFQDAGSAPSTMDLMKTMIDEGAMPVRLWVMVSGPTTAATLDKYKVIGYGNDHLTIRAMKMYADGALGSRGAWLLAPYADKPDTTGLARPQMQQLPAMAQLAADHGFQLCVHAIGDRANREVLNIYEDTFKKAGKNGKDLRWRIEHAQHISAPDIPRFGQLGVIASMQAIHCTSDGTWVPDRIGAARAEEGAYVWQKLMKSGALIANGTDAPVEDIDPIPSFYASVSRRAGDGSVFYPDQRMSRMEALKSYTINAAYAGFDDGIKGSLRVGKLADITVFSKDLITVPEDQIPSATVLYTIVGGKVQYSSPR
jgi:predicted amidohydrolase YtcJ